MSRAFCIPGVIFLLCAFALNFLVSISLPWLPALDIARTHFGNNAIQQAGTQGIKEIRFGIWAPCYYNTDDDRTCLKTHHGYSVEITNARQTQAITVKSSWTRGLAVHPVATAATFVAFLLSLSSHVTVTLLASLFSFLAALITLIAFAIDIALYALVRHEMKKLEIGANTNTAPGFWMTLVAFVLLLLAGCTVCFGRRRDRLSGATTTSAYPKPSFFNRFRRTKA